MASKIRFTRPYQSDSNSGGPNWFSPNLSNSIVRKKDRCATLSLSIGVSDVSCTCHGSLATVEATCFKTMMASILLPVSAGECVSAIGPKDTFDGSAQGKSRCEDDINKGLVDGRVECRNGVHVGSEVVLKCEGYNDEGACDMLC